jgi:nucleoside-diphosphate-sugar epimerase
MRVFVTGASGHIASAVIPELVAAGHEVTGLARSGAAAAAVAALGATVRRGDLDDLANLQEAAAESDGVIHLAFKHEQMRSGAFQAAVAAELAVTDALGRALAGSGKPLVIASGTLGVAGLGRPATEADPGAGGGRMDAENAVLALADKGVRSSVVRIAPVTHGPLDGHGFAHVLIGIARQSGVAGYPGDGTSRWPAGHTLDVGHCFCLALEKAPAGTRWHPAGDEGIPQRQIAESIGRHLGLPVQGIPEDQVAAHFSFLGGFIGLDNPVSTAVTREVLGWEPTHPGLLEDFDNGTYFPS